MDLEKSVLDFLEGLGKVDFDMVLKYTSGLLVLFWLVVVAWVWFDASERTEKLLPRLLSVIVVLFGNIPGLIIYLILRPKMTLQEQYWSDLERRYLMYETADLQDCEKCGVMLQPGFVFCPNCDNEVKVKCSKCGVNIDKKWKRCPFCGDVNSSFTPVVVKQIRYESFREFISRKYNEYKVKADAKRAAAPVKDKVVASVVKDTSSKKSKKKQKKSKNKKK